MVRAFEIWGGFVAAAWLLLAASAHASGNPSRASLPELCQPRDEKADAAALDAYLRANLQEHERLPLLRPLRDTALGQARNFLVQRLLDKRAEACADHLKLAEDVKAAPSKYASGACAAAAVVEVFDAYMTKVAGTFDGNRQLLGKALDAHLSDLKRKLFDVAKGSTAGLEGSGAPPVSAPKEVRFEWIKQEASKLGAEANVVWGAASPERNPLVLLNLAFAREAARARQERDDAKARFRTDGKMPPNCVKLK